MRYRLHPGLALLTTSVIVVIVIGSIRQVGLQDYVVDLQKSLDRIINVSRFFNRATVRTPWLVFGVGLVIVVIVMVLITVQARKSIHKIEHGNQ